MSNDVQDIVSDDEHFARWVYCPRYVSANGEFNERFISLRTFSNKKREEGISGLIYEKAGHENILKFGAKYKSTEEEERFVGYVKAKVGEIRNIADEQGTKIDVEYPKPKSKQKKDSIPFHAEIRFYINGDLLKGNNQNPYYLRYRKKLTELFKQDYFEIKSN